MPDDGMIKVELNVPAVAVAVFEVPTKTPVPVTDGDSVNVIVSPARNAKDPNDSVPVVLKLVGPTLYEEQPCDKAWASRHDANSSAANAAANTTAQGTLIRRRNPATNMLKNTTAPPPPAKDAVAKIAAPNHTSQGNTGDLTVTDGGLFSSFCRIFFACRKHATETACLLLNPWPDEHIVFAWCAEHRSTQIPHRIM